MKSKNEKGLTIERLQELLNTMKADIPSTLEQCILVQDSPSELFEVVTKLKSDLVIIDLFSFLIQQVQSDERQD